MPRPTSGKTPQFFYVKNSNGLLEKCKDQEHPPKNAVKKTNNAVSKFNKKILDPDTKEKQRKKLSEKAYYIKDPDGILKLCDNQGEPPEGAVYKTRSAVYTSNLRQKNNKEKKKLSEKAYYIKGSNGLWVRCTDQTNPSPEAELKTFSAVKMANFRKNNPESYKNQTEANKKRALTEHYFFKTAEGFLKKCEDQTNPSEGSTLKKNAYSYKHNFVKKKEDKGINNYNQLKKNRKFFFIKKNGFWEKCEDQTNPPDGAEFKTINSVYEANRLADPNKYELSKEKRNKQSFYVKDEFGFWQICTDQGNPPPKAEFKTTNSVYVANQRKRAKIVNETVSDWSSTELTYLN